MILMIVCVLAIGWFAATLFGWTPLTYQQVAAATVTAGFALANLSILAMAAYRISSVRFAGNRRRGERFMLDVGSRLDDREVKIVDISLTGASLSTTNDHPPDCSTLALTLDDQEITLAVVERTRRFVAPAGTVKIGVEFDRPTKEQLAAITHALFHQPGTTGHTAAQPTEDDPTMPPQTETPTYANSSALAEPTTNTTQPQPTTTENSVMEVPRG